MVEVADSSLVDDRGDAPGLRRGPDPGLLGRQHPERRIDVYTGPSGPAGRPTYASSQLRPGDEVPVVLDGREVGRIAVRDVLP